jgi:hypothetical protein
MFAGTAVLAELLDELAEARIWEISELLVDIWRLVNV